MNAVCDPMKTKTKKTKTKKRKKKEWFRDLKRDEEKEDSSKKRSRLGRLQLLREIHRIGVSFLQERLSNRSDLQEGDQSSLSFLLIVMKMKMKVEESRCVCCLWLLARCRVLEERKERREEVRRKKKSESVAEVCHE